MVTITKRGLIKRVIGYPAFLAFAFFLLWIVSIRMPGETYSGPLPPLSAEQTDLRDNLRGHVMMLAGRIGERNSIRPVALDSAAEYVKARLMANGYKVTEQVFTARGQTFRNLEVTLPGRTHPEEIIVVGGHYDSVPGTTGADDNASGTAAVIELSRLLRNKPADRTIRFVAFTNEEPPFFFSEDMGSRRYSKAAKERGDKIIAMISLETIGYYKDAPGSQRYPAILGSFYPNRGDFVGVVGNIGSRHLVRTVLSDFRQFEKFPSQGSAAPRQIPGISWSDQWSFWKDGYEAVMITDTAPFRNSNYHEWTDRPDSLDYGRMARVVTGVSRTVEHLASNSYVR